MDKDESIILHIKALRSMLLKCFGAIAICIIPALFTAPFCLDLFIKHILRGHKIALNYFSPVEVFIIQIKIALMLAIIFTLPYTLKQIWNFCCPGLYEHEKKFIKSLVFSSSTLFILGAIFCLCVILPFIIDFGVSFSTKNIHCVFGISNVINLAFWLIIAFGIVFQLPLITFSLIKSRIISYNSAVNARPYVVCGVLIFAAIFTPPDIVSQILLFAPAYLLFELGLLISKRYKE